MQILMHACHDGYGPVLVWFQQCSSVPVQTYWSSLRLCYWLGNGMHQEVMLLPRGTTLQGHTRMVS